MCRKSKGHFITVHSQYYTDVTFDALVYLTTHSSTTTFQLCNHSAENSDGEIKEFSISIRIDFPPNEHRFIDIY